MMCLGYVYVKYGLREPQLLRFNVIVDENVKPLTSLSNGSGCASDQLCA